MDILFGKLTSIPGEGGVCPACHLWRKKKTTVQKVCAIEKERQSLTLAKTNSCIKIKFTQNN